MSQAALGNSKFNSPGRNGPQGISQMGPQGMNQMGPQGMNQMGSQGMNNNMKQQGPGMMAPPGNMGGPMNGGMMAVNRQPFNSDPAKGGFSWKKPGFTPGLAFNEYVGKTPDHKYG
jgi:hypothetical protein